MQTLCLGIYSSKLPKHCVSSQINSYIYYCVIFWRELNTQMSEEFLSCIFKELLKIQLHTNHTSHETRVIYFTTLDLIIW